ncbi:MAG: serine kinase [Rhodobacteraceae bacterium]|nr:serine kinase [Paracoccaceae bacterium]
MEPTARSAQDPGGTIVHGSAVALGVDGAWRGLLITGPSGAGKSALALELMSRGARLIADDRVVLRRCGAQVRAAAPPTIAGMIEARGIGLLRVPDVVTAPVVLAVDLCDADPERLPPPRRIDLKGQQVPQIRSTMSHALAAALVQILRGGMIEVPEQE